jgi:hypothetical protein
MSKPAWRNTSKVSCQVGFFARCDAIAELKPDERGDVQMNSTPVELAVIVLMILSIVLPFAALIAVNRQKP